MTPNRKHFIDELHELNNKVSNMGDEVYNSYIKLISVCETRDLDLAEQIMEQDKLINELEISINVDAYLLIAKQCPVASDLRRIITALKIQESMLKKKYRKVQAAKQRLYKKINERKK